MSALVDVQVSLVNTDNRELLLECLRSLGPACTGVSRRIAVVDNASSDGSAEVLHRDFPEVELIRNERRLGFSANHNQVIRPTLAESRTRYLLILNEDTVLDPGAVDELVTFADARPSIGALGPVIRGDDGALQPSLLALPTIRAELAAAIRPGAPPRNPRDGAWLNGSCILIRVEALKEIGPLDERFFIFSEDTDLGYRLWRAGWTSSVCPAATMLHCGHSTVSRPETGTAMERQMVRSRYLYLEKHHGLVEATFVSWFVRCTLAARACKAWLNGALSGNRSERELGALLIDLARWDPRRRLPHELAAEAAQGLAAR